MLLSRFADSHRIRNSKGAISFHQGAPFLREVNKPSRRPLSAIAEVFAACTLEDLQSGLKASVARAQRAFSSARALVAERYTARGYQMLTHDGHPRAERNAVTLVADEAGKTLGTMTLRMDNKLAAQETYREEVRAILGDRGSACELTCLALAADAQAASQATLAVLFRLGYFIAHKVGITDVFIEVNPRHAAFYRRVLGFTIAAGERICPRVQAPAVLLHTTMAALGLRLGGFPVPGDDAQLAAA